MKNRNRHQRLVKLTDGLVGKFSNKFLAYINDPIGYYWGVLNCGKYLDRSWKKHRKAQYKTVEVNDYIQEAA